MQEKKTTNVENKAFLKQLSILTQIYVLLVADNEVNAVTEFFDLSAVQTDKIRKFFLILIEIPMIGVYNQLHRKYFMVLNIVW